MPTSLTTPSFASDPRTNQARRMANKFHDPMRTRVLFYLNRLYIQKQNGEPLSQCDMDLAIGRATADGLGDKAVAFDREQVIKATQEAMDGKKTKNLRELVDANLSRDSR